MNSVPEWNSCDVLYKHVNHQRSTAGQVNSFLLPRDIPFQLTTRGGHGMSHSDCNLSEHERNSGEIEKQALHKHTCCDSHSNTNITELILKSTAITMSETTFKSLAIVLTSGRCNGPISPPCMKRERLAVLIELCCYKGDGSPSS